MMTGDNSSVPRKINLFCFPFAGGSFYSYKEFEKYIPDYINMIGIDLPGHGRRMREPLLKDVHEMAEDIFYQIKGRLYEPYAIYGHSLGAILSYLFAQRIVKENMPYPVLMFLSGRAAPPVCKEKYVHLLPKQEFIKKVNKYGGIPNEILQEEELMDFMVPILRADFEAAGTYKYEETVPLDIPMTVMTGLKDEEVEYKEALKWQEVATEKISVRQFPGGHFFIFEHPMEIVRILCQNLEKALC